MNIGTSRIYPVDHFSGISPHLVAKWRTTVSKLFGAVLILTIFITGSRWEQQALMPTGLFVFGAILCGIGTLGRLWCSTYIAGYKDDRLITQGPYSLCRNPLYFFSAIGALGVTLATETLSIPLLILIAFGLYYPFVIKDEERALEKRYASAYLSYRTETPIFIPKLSSFSEPAEYLIRPPVLKRHFMDAIWFVWFFGMVAGIVKLHTVGHLPTLLSIY